MVARVFLGAALAALTGVCGYAAHFVQQVRTEVRSTPTVVVESTYNAPDLTWSVANLSAEEISRMPVRVFCDAPPCFDAFEDGEIVRRPVGHIALARGSTTSAVVRLRVTIPSDGHVTFVVRPRVGSTVPQIRLGDVSTPQPAIASPLEAFLARNYMPVFLGSLGLAGLSLLVIIGWSLALLLRRDEGDATDGPAPPERVVDNRRPVCDDTEPRQVPDATAALQPGADQLPQDDGPDDDQSNVAAEPDPQQDLRGRPGGGGDG